MWFEGLKLHQERVANEADRQAFDVEGLAWVDQNDGVIGVFREQFNAVCLAAQTFDGDFIAKAGHHNLTVANFFGGFHGQQIAIHDAGVSHGHAAHAQ